jgi:hypothetical protein
MFFFAVINNFNTCFKTYFKIVNDKNVFYFIVN